ncbi:MAG: DUF4180 domain-containing protein [Clostridia bacterium]|nr:DUF4180 domain-containing protein [Clostridia bacterium]MBQ8382944.1 DUF4180 domain-containing protein [Clostridia bacterium]
MKIETITQNGVTVAIIHSDTPILTDLQSALDLIMTAKYEAGTKNIILNKEAVCEDFFILSTCLAGEVLQKFINYGVRFAIYGDFSGYTSKPLKDFIYESNKGKDVYFLPDPDSAVARLCGK